MYIKTIPFKKRLVELDMNQKELADKIGLSLSYVSNLINGRKKVNIDRRLELIEILGYEPKNIRRFFIRKRNDIPKVS